MTVKPAAKGTDWQWSAQAPGYTPLSGTAATREAAKQAVAKATQAATSEQSDSYVLSYRAPVPTAVVSP